MDVQGKNVVLYGLGTWTPFALVPATVNITTDFIETSGSGTGFQRFTDKISFTIFDRWHCFTL